ncbi:MAG: asparaginase domain-containing protein, partial [Nanoarchaeota archaeon]
MKIRIFTTGGTIDGLEYDSEEKSPKNKKTIIPLLLKQSRVNMEFEVESLISKDSRFVNGKDREFIAEKCRKVSENKIIITHGTFTMVET